MQTEPNGLWDRVKLSALLALVCVLSLGVGYFEAHSTDKGTINKLKGQLAGLSDSNTSLAMEESNSSKTGLGPKADYLGLQCDSLSEAKILEAKADLSSRVAGKLCERQLEN